MDVDSKGPAGDGFEKLAFGMRLRPGAADEYRRRHDEIPSELVSLLKQAGVSDYSIPPRPGGPQPLRGPLAAAVP